LVSPQLSFIVFGVADPGLRSLVRNKFRYSVFWEKLACHSE